MGASDHSMSAARDYAGEDYVGQPRRPTLLLHHSHRDIPISGPVPTPGVFMSHRNSKLISRALIEHEAGYLSA